MNKNLWQTYFFQEALKITFLFLFCFFFLFILIDAAFHIRPFLKSAIPLFKLATYYLCQLSLRASILLPFALMVATIKVLAKANVNRELIALFSAGLSPKKLIQPFLYLALFTTALLYINEEWIYPKAALHFNRTTTTYLHKSKRAPVPAIHVIDLEDGSHLIYQTNLYDGKTLSDLYWIKSFNEIYRIAYLDIQAKPPQGHLVEWLKRSDEGVLLLEESFDEFSFEGMLLPSKLVATGLASHHELPITTLFKGGAFSSSYLKAGWQAALQYKLLIPLLCPLVVLAIALPCMRFYRTFPLFSLYAISIVCLILFLMLFDALKILAESEVIPSNLALSIPLLLAYIFTLSYFILYPFHPKRIPSV